jgi:hypothetical protein
VQLQCPSKSRAPTCAPIHHGLDSVQTSTPTFKRKIRKGGPASVGHSAGSQPSQPAPERSSPRKLTIANVLVPKPPTSAGVFHKQARRQVALGTPARPGALGSGQQSELRSPATPAQQAQDGSTHCQDADAYDQSAEVAGHDSVPGVTNRSLHCLSALSPPSAHAGGACQFRSSSPEPAKAHQPQPASWGSKLCAPPLHIWSQPTPLSATESAMHEGRAGVGRHSAVRPPRPRSCVGAQARARSCCAPPLRCAMPPVSRGHCCTGSHAKMHANHPPSKWHQPGNGARSDLRGSSGGAAAHGERRAEQSCSSESLAILERYRLHDSGAWGEGLDKQGHAGSSTLAAMLQPDVSADVEGGFVQQRDAWRAQQCIRQHGRSAGVHPSVLCCAEASSRAQAHQQSVCMLQKNAQGRVRPASQLLAAPLQIRSAIQAVSQQPVPVSAGQPATRCMSPSLRSWDDQRGNVAVAAPNPQNAGRDALQPGREALDDACPRGPFDAIAAAEEASTACVPGLQPSASAQWGTGDQAAAGCRSSDAGGGHGQDCAAPAGPLQPAEPQALQSSASSPQAQPQPRPCDATTPTVGAASPKRSRSEGRAAAGAARATAPHVCNPPAWRPAAVSGSRQAANSAPPPLARRPPVSRLRLRSALRRLSAPVATREALLLPPPPATPKYVPTPSQPASKQSAISAECQPRALRLPSPHPQPTPCPAPGASGLAAVDSQAASSMCALSVADAYALLGFDSSGVCKTDAQSFSAAWQAAPAATPAGSCAGDAGDRCLRRLQALCTIVQARCVFAYHPACEFELAVCCQAV